MYPQHKHLNVVINTGQGLEGEMRNPIWHTGPFILLQAPSHLPTTVRGEWCSVLTYLGRTPLWGDPLHCSPSCSLLLGICLLRSMSSLLSERQTKQERERGRELKEQEIKRKSERARERKRDNRSCKPSHSNQVNTLPCASTNPIRPLELAMQMLRR